MRQADGHPPCHVPDHPEVLFHETLPRVLVAHLQIGLPELQMGERVVLRHLLPLRVVGGAMARAARTVPSSSTARPSGRRPQGAGDGGLPPPAAVLPGGGGGSVLREHPGAEHQRQQREDGEKGQVGQAGPLQRGPRPGFAPDRHAERDQGGRPGRSCGPVAAFCLTPCAAAAASSPASPSRRRTSSVGTGQLRPGAGPRGGGGERDRPGQPGCRCRAACPAAGCGRGGSRPSSRSSSPARPARGRPARAGRRRPPAPDGGGRRRSPTTNACSSPRPPGAGRQTGPGCRPAPHRRRRN